MSEMIFLNPEVRGSCYLAKSDKAAILFDPGMAYYADITIEKVKKILGKRPLDAVFLTHSHYDHVGALPYIRQRWPDVKVYAAEYAQKVLLKPAARQTIVELSREAAGTNRRSWDTGYPVDLLYVDEAVKDGDEFCIGDMKIRVVECIGHTRCSLSLVIDDRYLLGAETLGTIGVNGEYMPQFLVDYGKSFESIRKCRQLGEKQLWLPHHGLVGQTSEELWQWFEDELVKTKDFILNIITDFASPEDQLEAMAKAFWRPKRKGGWPRPAFDLNAQAMLRTIAREFPHQ
ncbi:MAG: MBL fold metallo-hydrolase [Coprococcus sp.]